MTLKKFCQLTGWPYGEFLDLPFIDGSEILSIYGLRLIFILNDPIGSPIMLLSRDYRE